MPNDYIVSISPLSRKIPVKTLTACGCKVTKGEKVQDV